MTITADWQVELNSLTLGNGATCGSGTSEVVNIAGLGLPPIRHFDISRVLQAGVIGGSDVGDRRSIDVDLELWGSTAANCGSALDTLVAKWVPSTIDMAFDLRIPGWPETTMRFYGRPRGVRHGPLLSWAIGYLVTASVTFDATDPLKYGAAVTSTTNAGTVATDRATITITGTGGTPSITNTSDSSGAIVWNTTLAGGATRIVDLRAKTVVDGSAVDKRSEVLNSSSWFRFVPGANSLTVTGCTQSTSLRPAYY